MNKKKSKKREKDLLKKQDINIASQEGVSFIDMLNDPNVSFDLVVNMVEKKGEDVNEGNGAPLFLAVQSANDRLFDYFIKKGARISDTLLISASQYGTLHMVEKIFELKKDSLERKKLDLATTYAIEENSFDKFNFLFDKYKTVVPYCIFFRAFNEVIKYDGDSYFINQIIESGKFIESKEIHKILIESTFKAALNNYCVTFNEKIYNLLKLYLYKFDLSPNVIEQLLKKIKLINLKEKIRRA